MFYQAALDANCADLGFALELRDVHIIAGILKSYLRELPDPVLSHSLYEEWVNAVKSSDLETRLHALNEVRATFLNRLLLFMVYCYISFISLF